MRNKFTLVACLFLTITASAGTLEIIAEDAGGGILRVGYAIRQGAELPVGFGIDISLSNSAQFQSLLSVNPSFPLYPGTLVIDDQTGNITDDGTAIVPFDHASALGGLGTSGLTMELGIDFTPFMYPFDPFNPTVDTRDFNGDFVVDYRDLSLFTYDWLMESGSIADISGESIVNMTDFGFFTQGDSSVAVSGWLAQFQLDGNGAASTTVTISENLLRGGVVGDNGVAFDVIYPEAVTVVVPEPTVVLLLGLGSLGLRRIRRKII
jgi:hypothetical protein